MMNIESFRALGSEVDLIVAGVMKGLDSMLVSLQKRAQDAQTHIISQLPRAQGRPSLRQPAQAPKPIVAPLVDSNSKPTPAPVPIAPILQARRMSMVSRAPPPKITASNVSWVLKPPFPPVRSLSLSSLVARRLQEEEPAQMLSLLDSSALETLWARPRNIKPAVEQWLRALQPGANASSAGLAGLASPVFGLSTTTKNKEPALLV